MHLKYFFPISARELLTPAGGLNALLLGEARLALRDCRKANEQFQISECEAFRPLGPGVVIDPRRSDGAPPREMGWPSHGEWRWLLLDMDAENLESDGEENDAKHGQAAIGVCLSEPPTPDELRRFETVPGLPAGNELAWEIPVARTSANPYGNLLSTFVRRGGNTVRRLQERDRELWERSAEVHDFLRWLKNPVAPQPQWRSPWIIEQALALLSVNYRVGWLEVAALEACGRNPLTEGFAYVAAHIFVGWQEWEEGLLDLQKKTSQAISPERSPAAAL